MTRLGPRQARRRYLVLLALRWLPTGMLIPVLALLPLERGLSLSELGMVVAAQGFVVLALELPTGGLSDSIGRRPVVLAAGVINVGVLALLFTAESVAAFAVAYALQGVYRALDSGPLEAWYVDAALAADPDADISRGLSHGGTALGGAVAVGALTAGGLVALDPLPGVEALAVPVLVGLIVQVVAVVATAVLLVEVRPAQGWRAVRTSVRGVPGVIAGSLRLLRHSRVLTAVICVELFWGFGMVAFETVMPVRLAEVAGGSDAAGAIMGPAASAAWGFSAVGAALVPLLSRRLGVPLTAAALRVLQGGTVVAMALFAGPVGLVAAYFATYIVHGAANPMHMTLLHQQVTSAHRTTVVSLNSMVAQPAGALGGIVLMAVADAVSVQAAMLVGAAVLAVAAPLYLPAHRAQRRDRSATPEAEQTIR
ncbi:putative MFS family arabinose efflux permease [Haloactinopolyspora alba]|uniref:Putative MFS family arabinose efflux permease n=1 Tax=Haloactinopolyspora alba TaxID=648780 RepID=A0A2P8E7P8_9ACTN|nr:MFS transporter [Haloactinopolyspora alba]PSL05448.1 putative MFS family arabinose efflux permease [Haloactinopolyspora alba]